MAHHITPRVLFALTPLAAAILALPASAQEAQDAAATSAPTTTITVTGRTPAPAVSGFGEQPLSSTPISARVLGEAQLRDTGARELRDLTRLDASFSDAYNAEGYYGNLSARGYVLDNRFNYRRDGLPISGETPIGLENKAGIELLKGTSGIQAGTSAPGGLVNYSVKRPDRTVRSAALGWRENGTVAAAVDLSQRFGEDERYGLRLNAGAERLRPQTYSLHGERHLLALAGDVKLTRDTLLEAEIEHSRQSQPSVPGFSMLGPVVPDAHAIDPRINLNNQPWSRPVVFGANTASLRLTQKLEGGWKATAHAMTQRLKTDDRLAYPFGCDAEGVYDRYCSNSSFDFYAFQSDNERRRSDALDLNLAGSVQTGTISHDLSAGVLFTRFESRLQPRLDDGVIVGSGTIDGRTVVNLPALGTAPNTNRDERSTELYLRDAIQLTERLRGWLGLRHTRLDRESVRTDGSRPTDYSQSFTTPWAAVSYAFAPQHIVYASWGQGIESYVTPNKSSYGAQAGQALSAQKSRQTEIGLKGRTAYDLQWTLVAFDIDRPVVTDTGTDYFVDGSQRHRGVEALVERRSGAWQFAASAMALRARIEDSSLSADVRPANVPERTLRLMAGHDVGALPGLNLQGWLVYEGERTLLPQADSPRIGGWTRVDLAARYTQRVDNTTLTWRLGVDNAFDRRAWRESPYQYGHIYLYPLAPRTWRLSLQADF
ncbi:TonB-dependent siderophore receptor [Azohydromonas caseinilytica]|uniref:TonB-dependent siderophore receptor n=1 Tax=Azohydromonas caseinilytica TaxID=2728836 RepID=A0A848F4J9_9BURK|nr:TonB-dependent siderophore receptor [Azohydromonas caseinilytica]NML14554.1 TonB-dependent siderophore receptor [Azohydromonas caseinilytica]